MNCLRCGKETQGTSCPSCGYALEERNRALPLFELNIGEINAELQAKRRANRVCPACGERLPEEARFCPACGSAVSYDVLSFLKGAERGDAAAQNSLGYAYAHGQGVPKDKEKAKEWYRKSAARGNEEQGFTVTLQNVKRHLR